jgi:SAM-dependent methyltransferase
MPLTDRERWDQKYAAGEGPAHFRSQPFLIEHRRWLTGGRALDAACGFGGNALFLADLGYRVDAVDISGVALVRAQTEARRRGLKINFVQADLDRWWVPPRRYNLALVVLYLNRGLMPHLVRGLHPGGLLFQANRNRRFLAVRPGFPSDYLLEPEELRCLALDAGLEILYYTDGPPDEPYTSQLIARRPATPTTGCRQEATGAPA